jgi:hypothetical protein
MPKPFRRAGITKELIIARMISSDDPKIRALAPKLTALKGWTADQLFEVLCEMAGTTPEEKLGLKK